MCAGTLVIHPAERADGGADLSSIVTRVSSSSAGHIEVDGVSRSFLRFLDWMIATVATSIRKYSV